MGGVRGVDMGDGMGWWTRQERKLSDWAKFRGLVKEDVETGKLGRLVNWVWGETGAEGKLVA